MTERSPYYGVYQVLQNGQKRYVRRTATTNRKLAEEIALGLSDGEITMPDGSIRHVTPHPHIAQPIEPESSGK